MIGRGEEVLCTSPINQEDGEWRWDREAIRKVVPGVDYGVQLMFESEGGRKHTFHVDLDKDAIEAPTPESYATTGTRRSARAGATD